MKRKVLDLSQEAASKGHPRFRERGSPNRGTRREIGLAGLRVLTGRTQAQIALAMDTSQSVVSRLERQRDVLVSTLRDYVAATGGRLYLLADYPEQEFQIYLPILAEQPSAPSPARLFRVIWQNPHSRKFVHVGWLRFTGSEFFFSYTVEAELDPDFEPFRPFPYYRRTYRSAELFALFSDRLLSTARSDYDHLLGALGLTQDEATPVELLTRSWGVSPHDTLQIVPEPVEQTDGSEVRPFLVSGTRHVDEDDPGSVAERVSRLRQGQQLDLRDEPDNARNERAIVLEAQGEPVGWVPDYLLDYVHKQREGGMRVSVSVIQANGPETPWHMRLLCRLEVRPHEMTDPIPTGATMRSGRGANSSTGT